MVEEFNMTPSKNKPFCGLGAFIFENGKYTGDWYGYNREGKGTFVFSQSKIYKKYIGEWKDDAPNGRGILFYHDGSRYEGNFRGWKPSGDGIKYYTDGREYRGLWFDGVREDKHGLLLLNGIEEYYGGFKNDLFNGKGRLRYNNGNIYEGEWVDGYRNGKGKLKFAKGGIFEGIFFNGALDGDGIYKLPNGDVFKGVFSGPVVSGTANGKIEYQDGSYLECNLQNWKINGICTLKRSDGTITCYEYKNGKQIHILDEAETHLGQMFELQSEPNHYIVTKIKGHQKHVIFPNEYLGKSIEKIYLDEVEYPEEIEVLEFGNENELFEEKAEGLLKSFVNLKKIIFGKKMYDFPINNVIRIDELEVYKGGHFHQGRDGVYFKEDGSLYWLKYRGELIPKGTKILGSDSCKHASRIIYIPKSIEKIYYNAFHQKYSYEIRYEGSRSDWRKITVVGPNEEEVSGFFLDPLRSIKKFYKEESASHKLKLKVKYEENVDDLE